MSTTHGGPRPGAGRKPGVGKFAGGRPISTFTLRTGQRLRLWTEHPDENVIFDTVEVNVVSRTRIEFHVVANNGDMTGTKIVLQLAPEYRH